MLAETTHRSVDSLAPAPSSRNEPLHKRSTAEFRRLLSAATSDDVLVRLASNFLGVETPMRHFQMHGKLRTALAWHTLPDYLATEGLVVAGAVGSNGSGRHASEELGVAEFESLRLGRDLWLEIPKNLLIFVEPEEGRSAQRAVLRFEMDLMREGRVAVGAFHLDPHPRLLEDWFDYTRRANPLRGRKLFANGTLIEGRPEVERGRLFLPEVVRQRLDFALRRFVSPATARLAALGVRQRAGLILAGPPGTGKSTLGKELVETLATSLLWITPGDLSEANDVREAYEIARWLAPTVVFLEDLDLVAESRERGNRGSMLGQLMNELDGGAGDHPVLTIATTNRLEVVEQAVSNRPGRFDQILEIGPPDSVSRRGMLVHRLRNADLAEDLLDWSCGLLEGATGAEIEEVANSALAAAVFEEGAGESRPLITRSHLEEALERVSRHIADRKVGFDRPAARQQ